MSVLKYSVVYLNVRIMRHEGFVAWIKLAYFVAYWKYVKLWRCAVQVFMNWTMAVIYMQEVRYVQDLVAPAPLLHLGHAVSPKEIYTRIIYLSLPQRDAGPGCWNLFHDVRFCWRVKQIIRKCKTRSQIITGWCIWGSHGGDTVQPGIV